MKLTRPTQIELDKMSHAQKDTLIFSLFDLLEQLEKRLQAVEQQVKKSSRNSSKPPSSDGLAKAPAQPRTPREKPVGGQTGHKGTALKMTDEPDVIEWYRPQGECSCGIRLDELPGQATECRQQIDIPEPKIIITEHRKVVVDCPCGLRHEGVFPAGIPRHVSYGARLKAYALGLAHGHFVGLERTTDIINDQYGVKPSVGSLQKWTLECADLLASDYQKHQQQLIEAVVAHFDESGMRVAGKLHWLHIAANSEQVVYSCQTQRGQGGMDAAGILPYFKGIAVHDCWQPYWRYQAVTHALCNAHLLRELNYQEQVLGEAWITEFKTLLIEAKNAVHLAQQAEKTALEAAEVADFKRRYQALCERGLASHPEKPPNPGQKGRHKQHPATNLLKRLKIHQDAVLRFLENWQVPFDNNRAERAVRCVKVKLKVIGGFRSISGAQAFCVIRSIWETNKLHSQNPFETLRGFFAG